MKVNISINKDKLTIKECEDLAECLECFNTEDIIGILEGNEHSFKIGKNATQVKIKRQYK